MENKMFLVSFGNSDKYVATQQQLDYARESVEKYLKANFAGADVDYDFYKYAQVKEISDSEINEYKGYQPLDDESVKKLISEVTTGVEVMEEQRELNSNAGRW